MITVTPSVLTSPALYNTSPDLRHTRCIPISAKNLMIGTKSFAPVPDQMLPKITEERVPSRTKKAGPISSGIVALVLRIAQQTVKDGQS